MCWLLQATPSLAQCQARGLGTVPGTLSPIHKTRTHPALGVRNLAKVKLSLKLIAREYCPLLTDCKGLQLFFTLFNKPCCFCFLVSIVLLFQIQNFSCAVAGIKSLQIGHICSVLIRQGNAAWSKCKAIWSLVIYHACTSREGMGRIVSQWNETLMWGKSIVPLLFNGL